LIHGLLVAGHDVTIYADIAGKDVFEFFIPGITVLYFNPLNIQSDFLIIEHDYVILTEPSNNWFKKFKMPDFKRIGAFDEWNHRGISEVYQNLFLLLRLYSMTGYAASNLKLTCFTNVHFYKQPKTIGIHSGSLSNWMQKRWSAQNWRTLCDMFIAAGFNVLLFGRDPDFIDADFLSIFPLPDAVERFINQDRSETFAKIAACEYFIANDSGLAKVAIAAGVKTIELFGPTDEIKGRLINEVILENSVGCRPCQYNQDRMRACKNRLCMDIFPETVFNTLEKLTEEIGE
jgi:hypothetical protein